MVYPYDDENFKIPFITDQDIDFLKLISDEHFHWDLLNTNISSVNTYVSDYNVIFF